MLGGNSHEEVGLVLHTAEQCSIEGYPLIADMDYLYHWGAFLPGMRTSSENSGLPQRELEATQSVLEVVHCLHNCSQRNAVAGPKTCAGTLGEECHGAFCVIACLRLLINGPGRMQLVLVNDDRGRRSGDGRLVTP